LDLLRMRVARLVLLLRPLHMQIRHFCSWLAHEALPHAAGTRLEYLQLDIHESAGVIRSPSSADATRTSIASCPLVADLLRSLGVASVRFDVRLERNQVSDVLILLYALRRDLRRDRPGGKTASRILGPEGQHVACTEVSLRDGVLQVDYSYCLTRLSRLVQWLERRGRRFKDHRALFLAAPRYALLSVVIGVVPFLAYWLWPSRWVLMAATVWEIGTLFVLVYLLLMVIGSVEYDNEEKAYRLRRAYNRLDDYARRIREDLRQAEALQRRLIPTPGQMPRSDHLEWGSSFVPEAEVGGDYFDAASLDDHRVAVLFADVSGHGMSAAFITAILKSTFTAWVEDSRALPELLEQINTRLYRLTPEYSFAAVIAAVIDVDSGQVEYANAGHHPFPLRVPAGGSGQAELLEDGHGTLMGVVEENPCPLASVRLDAGDTLVFCTDGIIEAGCETGEMYGVQRLKSFLADGQRDTVGGLVRRLVEDAERFTGGAPASDDRTVLAVRLRRGED
jgi:serine phosphatase RsbU (regulator of sigma subunit)